MSRLLREEYVKKLLDIQDFCNKVLAAAPLEFYPDEVALTILKIVTAES